MININSDRGLPNEDPDDFEYPNIGDMFEMDIVAENVICNEVDEVLELIKSKLLNKQIIDFAVFVDKKDNGKMDVVIEYESD